MSLTPVSEALAQLLADVRPQAIQPLPLAQCLNKILRHNIASPLAVPPLDNSAMDGYALAYADLKPAMPISQRIAAGDMGEPLEPGTVARIFTGAPLPPGADTVVMQEHAVLDEQDCVSFTEQPSCADNVRPAGQDIALAQQVLASGKCLNAVDLGVAASIGLDRLRVSRPLRVALMSTGDELVEPGRPLKPGQIYNSNRPMLSAQLQALGCEVVDIGIVPDSLEATSLALNRAAGQADVIVSSGGVSAGEEDYVKAALDADGQLKLWKLAIKPGKPLAYGRYRDVPFFGLPGNPASSLVTFLVLLRPYLLSMLAAESVHLPSAWACADFDWPKPGRREEYLRVRLGPACGEQGSGILAAGALPRAELFPNQSSGVLLSASWGNALAVVPVGETVRRGDAVKVLRYAD